MLSAHPASDGRLATAFLAADIVALLRAELAAPPAHVVLAAVAFGPHGLLALLNAALLAGLGGGLGLGGLGLGGRFCIGNRFRILSLAGHWLGAPENG